MKLGDFEDPVLNERCNKGPVYLNRYLLKNFVNFCKEQEKDPQTVAEYLINLGIHTAEKRVFIDIENL